MRSQCRAMLDLSPKTEHRVRERAAHEGISVDDLINRLLDQTEAEASTTQNRILLSERDYTTFVDAIDNPPPPLTDGIRKAIANCQ